MVNIERCVIKTIDGKYVVVKRTREGIKLCVEDQQEANVVNVYTRSLSGKNQMALCFLKGGCSYVPMVAGDELKINKLDDESRVDGNFPDSHWFEKNDEMKAGEHYCLQSVVPPKKYLSIESVTKSRYYYITLIEDSNECVLVTDQSQ